MEKMDIYQKVANSDEDLSILSLPIHIDVGERQSTVMIKRLNDYYKLVERGLSADKNYDEVFFLSLRVIIDTLSTVFMLIDDCKFDKTYETLNSNENIRLLIDSFVIPISDYDFYRARNDKVSSVEEMFHVPSTKNYLSKSNRFLEAGYPGLYLSARKEGCIVEINEPGTVARFKRCSTDTFRMLDLTFLDFEIKDSGLIRNYAELNNNGIYQTILHQIWLIIASCYCLSFWCKYKNKQCEPNRQYMEEYTFPQMISRCLREKKEIDGIRYFTVRNENLNPSEKDMVDYLFFTKNYNTYGIDRVLRDKFCISIDK